METETKSYKLDYLLRGDLDERGAQEVEAKLRKLIEEDGGIIIQENNCRQQNLAYPIKKHNAGYAGLFKFIFSVEKIPILSNTLKKANLLRFLLKQTRQTREFAKKPVRKKPGRRPAIGKSEKLGIKTLLPEEEAPLKKLASPRSEPLRVEEIDKKLEEILGE